VEEKEKEQLEALRQIKLNRAMTQKNKLNKDNEMHVKTMFYSYKLNGDEPPEENELILDKKQQKIQDILETVVQMRKGVATAAFMEDVVSLKFAIENLET
jgi:hypothetical protein